MSEFSLFGRVPTAAVAPSSVEELQDLVRSSEGMALVPWGGGTRQHIGFIPERFDTVIQSRALAGIVEYRPDDLTVTARAGTTLAEIDAELRRSGQMLPFDIPEPERQTVGGVLATRPDSIVRSALGSVRDALLGVDVVNASGELIRAGGRVVKNVSGYDLPKLYCGSWGTLGMIVEATFRTSPLPEVQTVVLIPMTAERNTEDLLDSLLSRGLQPTYLFLLSPAAARVLLDIPESEPDRQFVVAGFWGASEDVDWQAMQLGPDSIRLPAAPGTILHQRLRDFAHREAPMTASFHILSSQVGAFSRMVEWTARRAGFAAQVVTDAACGIMRAHFLPQDEMSDWRRFYADLFDKAGRCGGSFIVERMPGILREDGIPVWSPVLPDFELMKGIKTKLDPQRRWNPGRFVGGI